MGNLVLANPSSQNQTVAALVTAVLLDEAILAALEPLTPTPETANQVYAGPVSGSAAIPAFRAIVSNDLPAVFTPKTLYSVAGTALPTPVTGLKGAQAVVSDATTPLYMLAYTGGGTSVCAVICDGTTWYTH